MSTQLGNILFDKLSSYFKENDSYIVDGEGLFERYLSIFGYDIDTVLLPLLESTTDILNPLTSEDLLNKILEPGSGDDEKFLDSIAYTLNYPIDVVPDVDQYRRLLTIILTLYKWRGTKYAIEYWGNVIGIPLEVLEIDNIEAKYDSGFKFDDIIQTSPLTTDPPKYDSSCAPCSEYLILAKGTIQTN